MSFNCYLVCLRKVLAGLREALTQVWVGFSKPAQDAEEVKFDSQRSRSHLSRKRSEVHDDLRALVAFEDE